MKKQTILNGDNIKEHLVIKKYFVMFRGRAHDGMSRKSTGHHIANNRMLRPASGLK